MRTLNSAMLGDPSQPLPGEVGVEGASDEEGDAVLGDDHAEVGARAISIADGRRIAQENPAKCAHTLHFCAKLLSNDLGCRLRDGMAAIPAPLQLWFKQTIKGVKSPDGVASLLDQLVKGKVREIAGQVMSYMCKPDFAVAIGFSWRSCNDLSDNLRKQDRTVLNALWRMGHTLAGSLLLTGEGYQLPPYCFLALVHEGGEVWVHCVCVCCLPCRPGSDELWSAAHK